MKYFLTLFLIVLSQHVLSARYEMNGFIDNKKISESKIKYAMAWEEEDGKIFGRYSDNYFSELVNLRGISGDFGRILIVTLPKEKHGVRTLTFLTSNLKGEKGSLLVPMTISLRDEAGRPLLSSTTEGTLIGQKDSPIIQAQEERKCGEGFGNLEGFCGIYKGMLAEDSDPAGKCNLLANKNTSLVFDEKGEIGLVLGEVSSIVNPSVHRVGRILSNPANTSIDILGRTCRSLSGTTFKTDDCKRMNITGNFTIENNQKHFTGKYEIIDEKTNQSCQYSLSMNLES